MGENYLEYVAKLKVTLLNSRTSAVGLVTGAGAMA